MIDSHCHVAGASYDGDREDVLRRAREAGLEAMIVVAEEGDLATNRRVVDLCNREPDCWGVLGIHPHFAADVDDGLVDSIRELAASPRVVAIGETGLDFHYDNSPRERQREEFRRFARLARELDLPLVVHSRAAADETIAILREERPPVTILHCFTYDADVARRALELDLWISFSGIVTFRKATDVQEAARLVPLERMLVETDSPFLAPEPRRGGRNEPARVPDVVGGLARVLGRSADEVAARTAANARTAFRLPASG